MPNAKPLGTRTSNWFRRSWTSLLLFAATPCLAQVLLIEGDSSFVVSPGAAVDLRIVLSSASLGGNVSGVNIRFITGGRTVSTATTDAAGKATTRFTAPATAGYYNVDAVAEAGEGAIATFAFTVGSLRGARGPEAVKADVRRVLLRNAADGSNLQLVGPYLVPAGTLVRPARWSKEKQAGGLWRAEVDSWLFWVDDGPSRSWAKPTRYYLIPGDDIAQARITGESWWPLIQTAPNAPWLSLGRATTFTGVPLPAPSSTTGDLCAVILSNSGYPGADITATAFEAYTRRLGVTRFFNSAAAATNCRRTWMLIAAVGNRDGIWLDEWVPFETLAAQLAPASQWDIFIESNQSGVLASWLQGRGLTGIVFSSTDALRNTAVQPLLGGFVARSLIPGLDRNNQSYETTLASFATIPSRPQFQRIETGGLIRVPLEDVEFSNTGGTRFVPFDRALPGAQVSTAHPQMAAAANLGNGILVQSVVEGQTTLNVTAPPYYATSTIRVGLGNASLRGCLISAGQTVCLGQFQRNIPAAEDEVGGHAFVTLQDPSIASNETSLYTWNRGERNIPLNLRGLAPGRTWLQVRSHDGNVMGDIPIQVAAAPPVISGLQPLACPDAATFRATFAVIGGDPTLVQPFGGQWWGSGIVLVFRKTAPDRFEIRSAGTTEGQFFAMGGTLNADCSFIGSGQGIAAQKVTTAQVRGRITPTDGVFNTMTLDYSIGVDFVFGGMVDYRGTATLEAGCGYQIRLAEPLTAAGGIFPLAISSPALCPWAVSGPVVAGELGFGPGISWLQIAENTGAARTIRINVAGQIVELQQPAAAPSYPSLPLTLGRFDTIASPGALTITIGNPLINYVRVPTTAKLGPLGLLQIEPTAPGIVSISERIVVTGINPALPLWVEVDGKNESATVIDLGGGLYELVLANRTGRWLIVRQGGRSSQRGALTM